MQLITENILIYINKSNKIFENFLKRPIPLVKKRGFTLNEDLNSWMGTNEGATKGRRTFWLRLRVTRTN